ncbi:hypothetical protein GCM10010530_66350 [Kribbella aluminosa]
MVLLSFGIRSPRSCHSTDNDALGFPRSTCNQSTARVKAETEREYAELVHHDANSLCRTGYLMCGDWRRAEDAWMP